MRGAKWGVIHTNHSCLWAYIFTTYPSVTWPSKWYSRCFPSDVTSVTIDTSDGMEENCSLVNLNKSEAEHLPPSVNLQPQWAHLASCHTYWMEIRAVTGFISMVASIWKTEGHAREQAATIPLAKYTWTILGRSLCLAQSMNHAAAALLSSVRALETDSSASTPSSNITALNSKSFNNRGVTGLFGGFNHIPVEWLGTQWRLVVACSSQHPHTVKRLRSLRADHLERVKVIVEGIGTSYIIAQANRKFTLHVKSPWILCELTNICDQSTFIHCTAVQDFLHEIWRGLAVFIFHQGFPSLLRTSEEALIFIVLFFLDLYI